MSNCAIVIPVHKQVEGNKEIALFSRSVSVFSNRDIFVVTPSRFRGGYSEKLRKEYPSLKFIYFDDRYFKSVKQYSRLLTSKRFYLSFSEYSHICICQLDVLSIRDDLDYWMSQPWHFIGGPLFEGYGKTNSRTFLQTLNGGFSLRNVESAIRVLDSVKLRYSKIRHLYSMEKNYFLRAVRVIRDGLIFNYNLPYLKPLMPEDIFWTYIAPRTHEWFRVPSPEVARFFAFDKHPQWLFELNGEKLPQAIHAWERFDPEFTEKILENNLRSP